MKHYLLIEKDQSETLRQMKELIKGLGNFPDTLVSVTTSRYNSLTELGAILEIEEPQGFDFKDLFYGYRVNMICQIPPDAEKDIIDSGKHFSYAVQSNSGAWMFCDLDIKNSTPEQDGYKSFTLNPNKRTKEETKRIARLASEVNKEAAYKQKMHDAVRFKGKKL